MLNTVQIIATSLIGVMNLFTFILFFVDKRRAVKRQYRISEKSLLLSSFALGGIGAWLGMVTFRHKTKHALFKFSLPVAAFFTLAVLYFVIRLTGSLSV